MSERDAMTLSEAIRVGAKMTPTQAYWVLYNKATRGTCALGAAAEAIGILDKENDDYTGKPPLSWKPVSLAYTACPVCGWSDDVQNVIKCLNNRHHWSRELISFWVATIERSLNT